MEIWTALMLGLVGSLHCAGMCGPLALALPSADERPLLFYLGRFGYNLGRVAAYCVLGLVMGLIGKSAALAGLQSWASLLAGIAILLALAPFTRLGLGWPAVKSVAFMKSAFASLLRRRTLAALSLLGFLNGFLPCGLVYVACAGALALGGVASAILYMLAFGLGTVPMMLAIGVLGKNLQGAIRLKFQKLIPVCMALLAVILILRGLSLGIPYVSPDLTTGGHGHTMGHGHTQP